MSKTEIQQLKLPNSITKIIFEQQRIFDNIYEMCRIPKELMPLNNERKLREKEHN